MLFFADFFKAITNCFKGFGLIFEKGLWPYLFFPILIWLLMWMMSAWLFASLASNIATYFNQQLQIQNIPDSGNWLSFIKPFLTGYFSVIVALILKIIFWFISSTFIKYVTLILLSPFFSLLSEATEEKLIGTKHPFNSIQFIKDIFRGISVSLRNMLLEYFFIALCFLITLFFPPLIILTSPLLLFISWYYIGFTMLDYNFERHKMTIAESVQFTRKHIGLACGIGIVYSFFMILPLFLGLMFGPILAIVGGSISFLQIKQTSSNTVVNV